MSMVKGPPVVGEVKYATLNSRSKNKLRATCATIKKVKKSKVTEQLHFADYL